MLDVVQRYAVAWRLLPAYDAGRLPQGSPQPRPPRAELTLREALHAIADLRSVLASQGEANDLFGLEHSRQLAEPVTIRDLFLKHCDPGYLSLATFFNHSIAPSVSCQTLRIWSR